MAPSQEFIQKLLSWLEKITRIRRDPEYSPVVCKAILAINHMGNPTVGPAIQTPGDRPEWSDFAKGKFHGRFCFWPEEFGVLPEQVEKHVFAPVFTVSKNLERLLDQFPDPLKMDLKLEEFQDWWSFVFFRAWTKPDEFRQAMKFRGLPELAKGEPISVLEDPPARGWELHRLNCDFAVATEAVLTSLILILKTYFPKEVQIPDLRQREPESQPVAVLEKPKLESPPAEPVSLSAKPVSQPIKVSKGGRPKKSPNLETLANFQKTNPDCLTWSATTWAETLDCSPTTIKNSKLWKEIMELRSEAKKLAQDRGLEANEKKRFDGRKLR